MGLVKDSVAKLFDMLVRVHLNRHRPMTLEGYRFHGEPGTGRTPFVSHPPRRVEGESDRRMDERRQEDGDSV